MSRNLTKSNVLDSDADQSADSAANNGWQARTSNGGVAGLASILANAGGGGGASTDGSLGQLFVLNDDGALSVAQSNSTSGKSSTSSKSATTTNSLTPTLVGSAGGFQINLVWDSSVASAPSSFESAIAAAAKYYTTLYSNKEVINIAVGFGEIAGGAMASGALGESESYGYNLSYSQVATALKAGASASNYAGDTNYVAQAEASLSSTDPTHGGKFFTTVAETKALGLVSGGSASSASIDGYIGLTSSYPLEYNQTATSGTYDAIGVAEHEIAEVMGRVGSEGSIFGTGEYTPLDLFRYSSSGVRDLTPNAGYFSINNGATDLGNYNNPLHGGDASDWISTLVGDSYGFGYSGATALVSSTDILENAVLGYHLTAAGAAATQHLSLK